MSVASVISHVASQITGAISQAARSTGISFEYLLATAQIESRLNPKAQAPTSSASGLYQFVDQTWLGTLKQDGSALGLGRYADAISQSADGRYTVSDPAMRTAILRLRNDPSVSALMAGAFTRNNAAQLASAIGRQPTDGELYIAHFLGSDGAAKLIGAAANNPQANAVQMFPQAATANRSVFFDRFGLARSAGGVYSELTRRYAVARTATLDPTLRGSIDPQTGRVPDTAGTTQALAAANPTLPVADNRPAFQSMFSDRTGGPVTSAVRRLWSTTQTAEAGEAAARAAAAQGQVTPLDLFVDHPRNSRALFGNGKA